MSLSLKKRFLDEKEKEYSVPKRCRRSSSPQQDDSDRNPYQIILHTLELFLLTDIVQFILMLYIFFGLDMKDELRDSLEANGWDVLLSTNSWKR
jgi:hypothetical protein